MEEPEVHEIEVSVMEAPDPDGFRAFLQKIESSEDSFSAPVPREGLTAGQKRKATRLQKKFEGQADTGTKLEETDFINSYEFFKVVTPPYNLDYLAALYEVSPAHAACVRAKVANIVSLGYKFHETEMTKLEMRELTGDKRKQKFKEIAEYKAALHKWTEGTNKEDTFVEVLRKVWTDVETMGNGYLEIGRKQNNEIGYIGHAPAQRMRVRRERDGFVQIIGRKVTYFRRFGETNTPPIGTDPRPNEIIHFKKYNPANSYYGIPDIIPAINNISGNEFAERFNIEYFENKAVPRYLIITKNAKLSQEAERQLMQFFQAGLKGQHHRTVYVPLSESMHGANVEFKIEPIEAKVQDASFVKYFQLNDDQIFMAHRVPSSKITMRDGANLAAARDADKTFKEQVARPEQIIIETKLDPIWSKKTDVVYFKLNEMTLTDEDTRSKIWERRLKTQSATPNEERADRGEIGLDGGDKVLDVFKAASTTPAERTRADLRPSERASDRSANAPDKDGEGRNASGEGASRDESK